MPAAAVAVAADARRRRFAKREFVRSAKRDGDDCITGVHLSSAPRLRRRRRRRSQHTPRLAALHAVSKQHSPGNCINHRESVTNDRAHATPALRRAHAAPSGRRDSVLLWPRVLRSIPSSSLYLWAFKYRRMYDCGTFSPFVGPAEVRTSSSLGHH